MSDEDIIQFSVGDKVTAEITNQNNLLLKQWALDNSASEDYIDEKMAELSETYSSQIEGINSQISSVNQQITNLNSSAVKTTSITKSQAEGEWKLSNNMTFKWKKVTVSPGQIAAKSKKTYSWSYTNFPNHCVFAVAIPNNSTFTCATTGISKSSSSFSFKNTNTGDSDTYSIIFLYALGF